MSCGDQAGMHCLMSAQQLRSPMQTVRQWQQFELDILVRTSECEKKESVDFPAMYMVRSSLQGVEVQ
jgi:hypothetical protein